MMYIDTGCNLSFHRRQLLDYDCVTMSAVDEGVSVCVLLCGQ